MYYVYEIRIKGVTRYIGYSNNLDEREKTHIYNCYNSNSKQYKKEFYSFLREIYPDKIEGIKQLILVPIYESKNKAECKKFEAFMILTDYFGNKNLKQSVPKLSDKQF